MVMVSPGCRETQKMVGTGRALLCRHWPQRLTPVLARGAMVTATANKATNKNFMVEEREALSLDQLSNSLKTSFDLSFSQSL